MDLYTKSKTEDKTIPVVSEINDLSIDEALKILEPSIKAFSAFGYIYKIISLTKELNTNIINLTNQRDKLNLDIENLKDEREAFNNTQINVLSALKKEHEKRILYLTNEQTEVEKKTNELKNEYTKQKIQLDNQTKDTLDKCKLECDLMKTQAKEEIVVLNQQANELDIKVKQLTEMYNSIKNKFKD